MEAEVKRNELCTKHSNDQNKTTPGGQRQKNETKSQTKVKVKVKQTIERILFAY